MSILKKLFGKAELEQAVTAEPMARTFMPAAPQPQKVANKGDIRREVQALLIGLSSPDEGVREASSAKMVGLGAPAVQPLIDSLKSPEKDTRLAAAVALGQTRDNRALSPLGQAENDEDQEVCAAAKASLKELRRAKEAKRLEEMKRKREQELEEKRREIKGESTWRLQFNHLLNVAWQGAKDLEKSAASEEELVARGAVTVPDGSATAETIGAGWKDLFARASDWSPYELGHSAEGLVKNLPAEEAARLIMDRFAKNKRDENSAHPLAFYLAATGIPEARPIIREWIEDSLYRKKSVAPAIASFVYGDVRPWADDLGAKKDYAALAAIFNCRDYSVAFQLWSRRKDAREILLKAGKAAVPAIVEAMDRNEVGIEDLAEVLLELEATEAIPALKRHLDSGRFASSSQNNDRIFKFVYSGLSLPATVSAIVAETGSVAENREKVEGLLRAAGWLGRGSAVLYCECGYPTRIRYSDGSIGPINPVLNSKSPELYVTEFSCPKCLKHVSTVTS